MPIRTRGYGSLLRRAVVAAASVWLAGAALLVGANAAPAAEPGTASLQGPEWDKLAREADALYAATMTGSRQSAFQISQVLERRLAQLESEAAVDGETAERLRMLASEAEAVRKALADGRPSAEWRDGAASLKLAVSALRDGRFAMWRDYEKLLREDAAGVARAWRGPTGTNAAAALEAIRAMKERAARLEAAALLEAGPQELARLNGRLLYTEAMLREAADGRGSALADEAVGRLDEAVDGLFGPEPRGAGSQAMAALFPPAGGPSWQWPAALWTIICAALLYAGWRKYRADRGTPVPPLF